MPSPPHGKPLSAARTATLKAWVPQGAADSDHWAFTLHCKPEPPPVAARPVDAFVRERLVTAGLTPAPSATPEALCRRLHLDLIGLPPTPMAVDEFAAAAATGRPPSPPWPTGC